MIDIVQYENIVSASTNYRFTSINHPDYDEFIKYDILKMDENTILLIDNSKDPLPIQWATNSLNSFIKDLKEITTTVYINFVPREFVEPLENIGFLFMCEYVDFFNEDINNTKLENINYDDIQFLLLTEVEKASELSFLCQWQSRGFKGETADWFQEWMKENKVIVVKINKVIIGYCSIAIYGDGTILWIREIAVNPLYQGKGYGKVLIEQALTYGIKNGAKRGFLAADVNNIGAIGLYNKYNFFAHNDESEIQMVKGLIPIYDQLSF